MTHLTTSIRMITFALFNQFKYLFNATELFQQVLGFSSKDLGGCASQDKASPCSGTTGSSYLFLFRRFGLVGQHPPLFYHFQNSYVMSNQQKELKISRSVQLGHADIKDLHTCKEVIICYFNQIDPDTLQAHLKGLFRMAVTSTRYHELGKDYSEHLVANHEKLEELLIKLISLFGQYQQGES